MKYYLENVSEFLEHFKCANRNMEYGQYSSLKI